MASLFQTKEWAEFKTKTGYQKYHEVDGIFVLQKKLYGSRTMLYAPMVDIVQSEKITRLGQGASRGRKVKSFNEKLKDIAKENNAIFFRVEFDTPIGGHSDPAEAGEESLKILHFIQDDNHFIKSFEEMQPDHTLILDISKSEEEILAQMKQKGRYNIKVAERHGVRVEKSDRVDNFYRLYEEMAKRQKITFRAKSYFQILLDTLSEKGYCQVFEAKYEGRVLAVAIVGYYGDRATYLFGGSSSEYSNVMAPYLLQWEIIKDAKSKKMTEYDFFGIAENDDPTHAWAGVTRFKKQFGGEELHLAGSYDMIYKPALYKLFKLAERIRRK